MAPPEQSDVSEYEKQRLQNILANKAKLAALGIPDAKPTPKAKRKACDELEVKSRRRSHPSRHPRRRTARPHRPGTPHSESAPRPLASRAHQQPRTYCHPAVQARSPLNARRLAPPSPLPRRRRSARQLRQLAEAILFSLLTGSVLQIGAAGRCCGRACHRPSSRYTKLGVD